MFVQQPALQEEHAAKQNKQMCFNNSQFTKSAQASSEQEIYSILITLLKSSEELNYYQNCLSRDS